MKLQPRKWTQQQEDDIIRLFMDGRSYGELAVMYNVTRNVIAGMLKRIRDKRPWVRHPQVFRRTVTASERVKIKTKTHAKRHEQIVQQFNSPPVEVKPLPVKPEPALIFVANGCKYPLWSSKNESMLVCNDHKKIGSSYCLHHHEICHTPTQRSSARASRRP